MFRWSLFSGYSIVVLTTGGAASKRSPGTGTERVRFPRFDSRELSARVAWGLDEHGKLNIYGFLSSGSKARRLPSYREETARIWLYIFRRRNTIVSIRGVAKIAPGIAHVQASESCGRRRNSFSILEGRGTAEIDAATMRDLHHMIFLRMFRDGGLWLAPLDGKEKRATVVRGIEQCRPSWSPFCAVFSFVSFSNAITLFYRLYPMLRRNGSLLAPTGRQRFRRGMVGRGNDWRFVRQPAIPRDAPGGYFIEPEPMDPGRVGWPRPRRWKPKRFGTAQRGSAIFP